jgi:cytochrome c5
MHTLIRRCLMILVLLTVFGALAAAAAAPDGKAVFASQKCSMCHSVQSAGIERTMKSSKAKDLSTIGSERDAAWLTKWLKKEEKIDGKPHQKAFTGSDAELSALVSWLGTLKK